MLITLVLTVLIVFASKKKSFYRNIYLLMPFVAWQIMEFIVTGKPLIDWGYQALLTLLPLILGGYILRYKKEEEAFWGKIICIAFLITTATTIIGLLENPGAARWLATVTSSEDVIYIAYGWKNIGGYEFIYSVVLLYPLIIFAYKQKKLNLFVTLCMTVSIFVLLVLAEYTTALLLFLISSILFLVKRDVKKNDIILLFCVTVIFCLLLNEVVSDTLIWLGDKLNSETISERLYTLAGRDTELSNMKVNRFDLYLRSLNTFLEHPLFGTFFYGGYGSGSHSFILDTFARFGLIGAITLFFMYKKIFMFFYLPLKVNSGYGFVLWIFIQAIILSFLNTGMWLPVLTLYVPILVNVIYKEVEAK